MSDRIMIIAGLAVFLALATFPFWHTLGFGGDAAPPDLEFPKDADHCVEDTPFMVANHMDLLNRWRDAVVRQGRRYYTSKAFGEKYEMSLTKTCMGCHTNRQTFCARCHEYADVQLLQPLQESAGAQQPQGGIRCWDCHIDAKED